MKIKYKILLTAIIASIISMLPMEVFSADEKLYVFFKDIDYIYDKDGNAWGGVEGYSGTPTEFIYWEPLLKNDYFTPNLLKTGYSAFFATGKKLTNYEVAVFFMGDKPLQWDGGTGHRVVDEIKDMLDAGKRVILIGNALLFWAFHPQSTQRNVTVQNFFEDYLGIDANAYLGAINTMASATQFKPFGVKAIQGDEVSLGYKKACNVCQTENTPTPLCPWRARPWVDAIDGKRMGDSTVKMEFFTWTSSALGLDVVAETDTVMGVHVERASSDPVQNSKIVFWTTGFEVAAASFYMPSWQEELFYALRWCTTDLPSPGPFLTFNTDPLDFGTVPKEDSLTKEFKVTNTGRETLKVSDYYFFDDIGAFDIKVPSKDRHFELKPGESEYIPVKFSPLEEIEYQDRIDVESNASNGPLLEIRVVGWGGKKPSPGAKIELVKNTLDFGTLAPMEVDTLAVEIVNTGVGPLFIMQSFYWPTINTRKFRYATNYTWTITIEPGDTCRRLIKFVPSNDKGTFYDTLGVIPYNAVNAVGDTIWVYMKGISGSGGNGPDISLTTTELFIDSTKLGQKNYAQLYLENTGNQVIYVNKLELENTYDDVFKLFDKNDEEIKNSLPWQLSLAGPPKKRLIKVEFAPKDTIVYTTRILIELMDEYDNPLPNLKQEVNISAIGKDTTTGISVNDGGKDISGITLRAAPNPIGESGYLHYSVNTTNSVNLDIFITDVLGNRVYDIVNKNVSPGDYNALLNTSKLASGMYFIVARSGTEFEKIPLQIIK